MSKNLRLHGTLLHCFQRSMYGEMVDKEQQINESNQMYGQLQDQLELMLDTIARETNDIKQLEQQLNEGMGKHTSIADSKSLFSNHYQTHKESSKIYGPLQNQLELMLDTVARETNNIKQLEQQLRRYG